MRTFFILASSVAFVIALEAVVSAFRYFSQRRKGEIRRRLRSVSDPEAALGLLRSGKLARSERIGKVLERIELARTTERLLDSADARITVAQLWSYCAALAVAMLVVGVTIGAGLAMVFLLAVLAAIMPVAFIKVSALRRSRAVSEQLPEALEMMSRSLRAGHATSISIQTVAIEMPPPISIEFGRAFEEQRLGSSLDRAVLHMTARAPENRDLKIFATSVMIQKETGGNLAEMLSGIAETIRARYRFQGKLRALTAEGRASAVILALLPFVSALMIEAIRPGFLSPLLTHPVGHKIALVGVLLWAAGILWVHQLTKIDV